eukprot:Pgem_evm1s14139
MTIFPELILAGITGVLCMISGAMWVAYMNDSPMWFNVDEATNMWVYTEFPAIDQNRAGGVFSLINFFLWIINGALVFFFRKNI